MKIEDIDSRIPAKWRKEPGGEQVGSNQDALCETDQREAACQDKVKSYCDQSLWAFVVGIFTCWITLFGFTFFIGGIFLSVLAMRLDGESRTVRIRLMMNILGIALFAGVFAFYQMGLIGMSSH